MERGPFVPDLADDRPVLGECPWRRRPHDRRWSDPSRANWAAGHRPRAEAYRERPGSGGHDGHIEGGERRADAFLVRRGRVVQRQIRCHHPMSPRPQLRSEGLPARGVVPGSVQQTEQSHDPWLSSRWLARGSHGPPHNPRSASQPTVAAFLAACRTLPANYRTR